MADEKDAPKKGKYKGLVRATAPGHYAHKYREQGEVFEVKEEKHFSDKWMEPYEKKAAAKTEEDKPQTKAKPTGNKDVV